MAKKFVNWWLRNGPFSRLLAVLLMLRKRSYLSQTGWFRSVRQALPSDRDDNAIPWFSYPAIEFLQNRLNASMRVFEYGSGNSTIWWSKNVASVVSCEHDAGWFARMQPNLPASVTYIQRAVEDDYAKIILEHDKDFDVIVIDGRDRVNCAKNCLNALNDTGVVIWDNSDRSKYQEGFDFLTSNGFRRIDFVGLGPIITMAWSTSIFYRPGNVLGI